MDNIMVLMLLDSSLRFGMTKMGGDDSWIPPYVGMTNKGRFQSKEKCKPQKIIFEVTYISVGQNDYING